jgi:hypothetical protein
LGTLGLPGNIVAERLTTLVIFDADKQAGAA